MGRESVARARLAPRWPAGPAGGPWTGGRAHLALVALVLTVTLGACKRTEVAPTTEHVDLGVARLRISLPIFVADKRGIFRKHGLDVTLKTYETAQPMLEEVVDGRTDAGGFVAYPIVFLASQKAKTPPTVVTSLVEDAQHRLSYALGRPGGGLRFPDGVRGKKIGILPTVAYQKWLDAILRATGIAAGEVTIVPIAPPLQAQALSGGGVDVMFTNDPMATAIIAAGVGEIIDDGPPCARRLGDPFAFGTFTLSDTLVRTRPAVAARLVAAVDEAIGAVGRDQGAARSAMAEFLRPEERAAVSRYPDARYLTSTEAGPAALEAEIARELALGILTERPSVSAWSSPR